MNIIFLHGDDIVKSRLRLEKFIASAKARGWEIQYVDKQAKLSLAEAISGGSLFQKERLFIVDDLGIITSSDFSWFKKNSKDIEANLVIYHDGYIPKDKLRGLPQPYKLEEFKLPKIIFDFLSSFYPGNSKKSLVLLHRTISFEPIEFVFALLGRHMRDLYLAKVSPSELPYPSWRLGMLKSQSGKFSQQSLEKIISCLAEIDIQAKTGGASLVDSLDLTIISQLQ